MDIQRLRKLAGMEPLNEGHALLEDTLLQTVPFHLLSCQGTRMDKCLSGYLGFLFIFINNWLYKVGNYTERLVYGLRT